MFALMGRTMYRLRWPVLFVSGGLFVVALISGSGVANRLVASTADVPGSESSRAGQLLEEKFARGGSSFLAIFSHPELRADDLAFAAEVRRVLQVVESDPSVVGTTSYLDPLSEGFVSTDKHHALVRVDLGGTTETAVRQVPRLRPLLRSELLQTTITGDAAFINAMTAQSEEDLLRAEKISLPLLSVVLVIVFGGLVAAAVPLVVGGLAIVAALGVLRLLTAFTEASVFSLNIITMLGLGLAIDYSLFIVSRFRQELERIPVAAAVERTAATAGRAVAFSGVVVGVGMGGLLFFPNTLFHSMGFGGMLVVAFTVLVALTFLPALLGVVGPHINRLRVRRQGRSAADGGLWERIANVVMRRAFLVLGLVLLVLVVLAVPVREMKLGLSGATILPESNEARRGFELLSREFPGGGLTRIPVVIQAQGSFLEPANLAALQSYTDALSGLGGVAKVDSVFSLAPGLTPQRLAPLLAGGASGADPGIDLLRQAAQAFVADDTARVLVSTSLEAFGDDTEQLVHQIRATPPGNGLTALVGGSTAEGLDLRHAVFDVAPWALAFVAVVTGGVLLVTFGSVFLPLKAVLMNILSITASLGVLVWIFQQGHLEGALRFTPQSRLDVFLPVFLFAVVFGLSTDYEVFLLSRTREEYDRLKDNRRSVARGLALTGGIITSAALLLIIVIGSFATAEVFDIKALGVGMAVAIALDASIVRALLVPATMRILGDWNWWLPRRLRWLHLAPESTTPSSSD